MTDSVPCWTSPLHRRHFPGEHSDSAEELELDSLRHQLREALAETRSLVLAERESCAEAAGNCLRRTFDQPTMAAEVEAAIRARGGS